MIRVVVLCLILAGCATTSAPVTVTGCPIITPHDQAFQRRLADAYGVAGPELQAVTKEWLSLRDQARACRRASNP